MFTITSTQLMLLLWWYNRYRSGTLNSVLQSLDVNSLICTNMTKDGRMILAQWIGSFIIALAIVLIGSSVNAAVVERTSIANTLQQTAETDATHSALSMVTKQLISQHLKFPTTMQKWAPTVEKKGEFIVVSGDVTETLKTGINSVSSYAVVYLYVSSTWVPVHIEVNDEIFLHTIPN